MEVFSELANHRQFYLFVVGSVHDTDDHKDQAGDPCQNSNWWNNVQDHGNHKTDQQDQTLLNVKLYERIVFGIRQ